MKLTSTERFILRGFITELDEQKTQQSGIDYTSTQEDYQRIARRVTSLVFDPVTWHLLMRILIEHAESTEEAEE